MYNPFYRLLDSVSHYFVEDFCVSIHKIFISFFSCDAFVWFWYQGSTDLIEWVRKCSSPVFWKSLWKLAANSPLNAQDEDLKCGSNPSKHKIMKSVSFQELRRMEQCYLWGHQDMGHLRGKASMEEKRKFLQKYCQRHSLLLPRALASCRKALDCRMTSFLKRTSPTGQLFPCS